MDLRKKILYEGHNTVFTMHPGGIKMYQDMKQYPQLFNSSNFEDEIFFKVGEL